MDIQSWKWWSLLFNKLFDDVLDKLMLNQTLTSHICVYLWSIHIEFELFNDAIHSRRTKSLFFLNSTDAFILKSMFSVTRRNYPPIPRRGDTFQEFTTRENYPPPLTKNKVNHINKIIMTKLSLMHPCLFKKKNFVLIIWFSWSIAIDLQRLV